MNNKIQLLIITSYFAKKDRYGGRQSLAIRNIKLLKKIFNGHVLIVKLKKKKKSSKIFYNLFKGHIDGIEKPLLKNLVKKIKKYKIRKVFIDGSNFGEAVYFFKKEMPEIKIYTFFHNVESLFFYGLFKEEKTIHSFGVFLANYLAERKSVNFSDKIILLSKRDKKNIFRIYGKHANCICPLTVEDQLIKKKIERNQSYTRPYLLFVGTAFYANIKGIMWFIKHVVPKIDIKIYIVGKGFEIFKKSLELNKKVKVFGFVNNIRKLYSNANLIVAPIFHGSGMKTKVAEAMMYGKKIVGTPEAFSGYDVLPKNFGLVSSNPFTFSNYINKNIIKKNKNFFPSIRRVYIKYYSNLAAIKIFEKNII